MRTITERLAGKTRPYAGHFEILRPDGSVTPVNSEGQNCLYHAVVQATSTSPADVEQKALNLRNQVKDSLLQETHRYAAALHLQRGYEETHQNSGKYTIMGGGRKTQHVSKKQYKDMRNTTELEDLPEGEISIINAYNLGLVGTYNDIKGLRKNNSNPNAQYNSKDSPVNADHIPPKNTFQKAFEMLQKPENKELKQSFEANEPKLYKLIDKNGNCGRCMEVLTEHHLQALTTGNSKEAKLVREHLSNVCLSRDGVELMKNSILAANPVMSENLRRDAGIPQKSKGAEFMSTEATRSYYTMGYKLLVNKYYEMGLYNQSAKDHLHEWIQSELYSTNSPQYHKMLEILKPFGKKQKEM
ncbi:uncharacterized protein LOC118564488 isoform X2 [Fundulus heteroclitus]|uniref:uncharacterized protein LOC118564488 isoform X2 n=1 Tax=Fundulus heteroclitus TaxID=8078 RepID=UPI00165B8BCD|nr:uncharacterized protein LOC118564488 isoform X2 [Fundulus heteroclitus]